MCDLGFGKSRGSDKRNLFETSLGDNHCAALVDGELDWVCADTYGVVRSRLDKFNCVIGCAGLGKLCGEQKSLFAVGQLDNHAAQLRRIMIF